MRFYCPLKSLFLLIAIFFSNPTIAQVVGDPDALEKVDTLLESVGGKENWTLRYLYVEETAYLTSGEEAKVAIWRDLEAVTRHLVVTSPGRTFTEIMKEGHGVTITNGNRREYSPEEFAVEKAGLEQGPYFVYHRLAKEDSALRAVYSEDGRRLEVYEGERLLCWFVLDGKGGLLSWGNIYDGAVNQHVYGPLEDLGNVHLPKWGAAINGNWRFEYTAGALSQDPGDFPENKN